MKQDDFDHQRTITFLMSWFFAESPQHCVIRAGGPSVWYAEVTSLTNERPLFLAAEE